MSWAALTLGIFLGGAALILFVEWLLLRTEDPHDKDKDE
jgi:hypothetical protein